MIKINLVPVKEKKKRKEFLIGFLVVVIFSIIAMGMFWIYIQRVQVRSDLKKEISQIEEESKGYAEKITEMKDLQNKEANLDAFKKTIKSISETQRKIVVAFDQLALNLPNGIWFTKINQGSGVDANKFIVAGYSFSPTVLKNYFSEIQRPGGLLKEPTLDLKSVTASVGNNKQIQQFEITVKVTDQGS
jgi:Tfp pilus assembly protein PilN